jgi:Zn-dependent peptidase ImmA (M78 family)
VRRAVRIVESDLHLGIGAIPGLSRQLEVDGYLSNDMTEIVVDESIMVNSPRRYRFTLAYEVGRFILQRELYEAAQIESLEDYQRWHNDLSEETRRWAQWQCYCFAGLILVPRDHLVRECAQTRRTVERRLQEYAADLEHAGNLLWMATIRQLSDRFETSKKVISKRLKYDGILPDGVDEEEVIK